MAGAVLFLVLEAWLCSSLSGTSATQFGRAFEST